MIEVKERTTVILDHAQAIELALLVDTEACWENMRKLSGSDVNIAANSRALQGRQKAYEAFRAKLSAYNSRYKPAHSPELLLNSPFRLGIWCRKMADLFRQLEHDPRADCPVHLLEKAYRCADWVGVRQNRESISRTIALCTIRTAIAELEVLADWCLGQATAVDPWSNPPSTSPRV